MMVPPPHRPIVRERVNECGSPTPHPPPFKDCRPGRPVFPVLLLLTNACSSDRREPFPKPCLFHALVQCVTLQQVSANVVLFVRDRNAHHASLLTDSCAHAPPHRDLASKLNSALLSRDGARACLTCRNLRIWGCWRRRARTRE